MNAISIIGGGIAGLALAARLDPRRFDVTIHEQRLELPTVGTSLAMWQVAQRALAALEILDGVRKVSPAMDAMAIRDASGNAWVTANSAAMIGVSRVDLMRLLEDKVPPSVRRETVRVNPVRTDTSELVVGADGVHSVVRRAFWGASSEALLTPYLAVRGVIGQPVPADSAGEYWGRGDLFGIGPAAGGTNWYAAYRSGLGPVGIDVAKVLEGTRSRYARHAPGIRQVLASATPETSLAQRIWTTPALRHYVRGRAVLIGDAAHAMAPNLGRGACEALIDAITLAGLLNSRPLPEALKAYNRQRHLRTQMLRVASAALMQAALAGRAQPARDRILRLAARRTAAAAVGSSR